MQALYEALAKFQSECPSVPKNKTGQARAAKYKYADLADIISTAAPIWGKHGLSVMQWAETIISPADAWLSVRTVVAHKLGGSIEGTFSVPLDQGMQQVGSQLTYAKRYALGAALCIATDEDTDGAGSSEWGQRQQQHAGGGRSDHPQQPSGPKPATDKQKGAVRAACHNPNVKIEKEDYAAFMRGLGAADGSQESLNAEQAGYALDALSAVQSNADDKAAAWDWINKRIEQGNAAAAG